MNEFNKRRRRKRQTRERINVTGGADETGGTNATNLRINEEKNVTISKPTTRN